MRCTQNFENGTIRLITIDESRTPLFSNGDNIRLYHKQLSKDSFFHIISSSSLDIIEMGEYPPASPTT